MTSGNPGVAQRVDAGADGELGDVVERGQPVFGETEIADEIEILARAASLITSDSAFDGFEPSLSRLRS